MILICNFSIIWDTGSLLNFTSQRDSFIFFKLSIKIVDYLLRFHKNVKMYLNLSNASFSYFFTRARPKVIQNNTKC